MSHEGYIVCSCGKISERFSWNGYVADVHYLISECGLLLHQLHEKCPDLIHDLPGLDGIPQFIACHAPCGTLFVDGEHSPGEGKKFVVMLNKARVRYEPPLPGRVP